MEVALVFRGATAKTAAEKSRSLKRGEKRQFKISTGASYYYNYAFSECTADERALELALLLLSCVLQDMLHVVLLG